MVIIGVIESEYGRQVCWTENCVCGQTQWVCGLHCYSVWVDSVCVDNSVTVGVWTAVLQLGVCTTVFQ